MGLLVNYKENFKFDQDQRRVEVAGFTNSYDEGISILPVRDDGAACKRKKNRHRKIAA